MASEKQIKQMLDALGRAEAQYKGAGAMRKKLIQDADKMERLTRRQIARAMGLTPGRVSQILNA